MGYFRELPNLLYQSFLPDKTSSLDYTEVKNLFRRVKLRDDLQNVFTLFDKYEIPDGYRPENVAENFYGNDLLDWVVILTAGIVNIRNEWPLSSRDIFDYSFEKYGDDLNATRFFETKEVKNSSGTILLNKGIVVDSDFEFNYYEDTTNKYINVKGTKIRTGISNYEYETRLNDEKRSIFLLKSEYLQQFINDFRDIMIYGQSSQAINENLIKTENTNITMP
jgi:hypothetical protein|tara:strand:- start:15 stop:680 length:666 start_codon:yes stop_codon:yes gene_type:complete